MELFPPRQLKLVHGNTQMGLGNRGCGQRPGGSRKIPGGLVNVVVYPLVN